MAEEFENKEVQSEQMRIAEMAIQQPNKAATKESTVQLDVHNVHVFTHSVLTALTIQAITTRKADSVLRALALVYRVLDAHSKEVIVHARTIMVAITIAVAITVVRSNRVAIVLVTTITMVKKVVISTPSWIQQPRWIQQSSTTGRLSPPL